MWVGAGQEQDQPGDLLSPKEVCEYLGIGRRTLVRYTATGVVPEPIRLTPRALRWRRGDLDETLTRRRRKRA